MYHHAVLMGFASNYLSPIEEVYKVIGSEGVAEVYFGDPCHTECEFLIFQGLG